MIVFHHKTTLVTCKPEHEVAMRLALMVADDIESPRKFRGRVNRGGIGRKYPKFTDGMSTAQYVREFAMLNAHKAGYNYRGVALSATDIKREDDWIAAFYAPLSTAPQFAPTDVSVEEDLV